MVPLKIDTMNGHVVRFSKGDVIKGVYRHRLLNQATHRPRKSNQNLTP